MYICICIYYENSPARRKRVLRFSFKSSRETIVRSNYHKKKKKRISIIIIIIIKEYSVFSWDERLYICIYIPVYMYMYICIYTYTFIYIPIGE